jgi:hypothetical protein
VLVLVTTVLVSGILSATVPTAVFANSRLLKQDTKQAANCDTVGAASPVSDSCNQRAANNVNNGEPKTTATPGTPGTPGTTTLRIDERCFLGGVSICFDQSIIVEGNNPRPSSFSLPGALSSFSQLVTLGPGSFTITQSSRFPFRTESVSGDCSLASPDGGLHQTFTFNGTISAGQHLTCRIVNTGF